MSACPTCDERLVDFFYGELPEGERQGFEQHLAAQPACASAARALGATERLTRDRLDEEPSPALLAGLKAEARKAVAERRAERGSERRREIRRRADRPGDPHPSLSQVRDLAGRSVVLPLWLPVAASLVLLLAAGWISMRWLGGAREAGSPIAQDAALRAKKDAAPAAAVRAAATPMAPSQPGPVQLERSNRESASSGAGKDAPAPPLEKSNPMDEREQKPAAMAKGGAAAGEARSDRPATPAAAVAVPLARAAPQPAARPPVADKLEEAGPPEEYAAAPAGSLAAAPEPITTSGDAAADAPAAAAAGPSAQRALAHAAKGRIADADRKEAISAAAPSSRQILDALREGQRVEMLAAFDRWQATREVGAKRPARTEGFRDRQPARRAESPSAGAPAAGSESELAALLDAAKGQVLDSEPTRRDAAQALLVRLSQGPDVAIADRARRVLADAQAGAGAR